MKKRVYLFRAVWLTGLVIVFSPILKAESDSIKTGVAALKPPLLLCIDVPLAVNKFIQHGDHFPRVFCEKGVIIFSDDKSSAVYAYPAGSTRPRWIHEPDCEYSRLAGVRDGIVYILDQCARGLRLRLVALDLRTGSRLWICGESGVPIEFWSARPNDTLIYFFSGGALEVHDNRSGLKLNELRYDNVSGCPSRPTGFYRDLPQAKDENSLIYWAIDDKVILADLLLSHIVKVSTPDTSPGLRKSSRGFVGFEGEIGAVESTPIALLSDASRSEPTLLVFDLQSDQVLWTQSGGWILSYIVADSDVVYGANFAPKRGYYCKDLRSGQTNWHHAMNNIDNAFVAAADHVLYCTDMQRDKNLHTTTAIHSLCLSTGELVWADTVSGSLIGNPVISDSLVVLVMRENNYRPADSMFHMLVYDHRSTSKTASDMNHRGE